jgi:DNA replication protein DnaC
MSHIESERLHHNLKWLKMTTFESILDNYLEAAANEGRSIIEILDYLVAQEVRSKESRSLALRMRKAGFPVEKRLDQFDFEFQPSIGFRVHFANASTLVEDLSKADRDKRLEEKIRALAKFQLLIVDEMGYLPFDDHGAHCFFQLISRRYERASTIFTSNKSYGEWGDIFRDHVIAAAILDRILHHCTTVNIKGDSYRLKELKRQGLIPNSYSR